jgi:hypothetical protein
MHGLTVRWSLDGLAPEVMSRLREYVHDISFDRFSGMDGLRFKTWRARPGEWFEGCYVFASARERDEFQQAMVAKASTSPVSDIVGTAPVLIEPCDIVAVAEGGAGFVAVPTYDEPALD